MSGHEAFTDYYDILRLDPGCDAKTLEAAYHRLAKMYHPDHTTTPDTDKFNQVLEAYRTLRDADERADYDIKHARHSRNGATGHGSHEDLWFDETIALKDAADQAKFLMLLYKARRAQPQDAGVIAFYIQEALNCSYDQLEFHKWYLKEKGFIAVTEQGTVAITIQGIDHVMSMSRTTRAEKLLLGQSKELQDRPD
ncbi:MAG: J domain-containing protein [Sphingomicrobium sp.]